MNFSKKNHELKNKYRHAVSNTRLTFLLVFLSGILLAQNGINYKAVIKDTNGNVVASSPISIQFIIYEGQALTNNVYQESHTINTDASGFVVINIGEGTTGDDFNTLNWNNDAHFINVKINTGSGLVDMGTTEFKAVPYAKVAENVSGLEAIDEGNGIGWRLVGRNPDNFGNIGEHAIDLSEAEVTSSSLGATGSNTSVFGINTSASGLASTASGIASVASGNIARAMGSGAIASGDNSTAMGSSTVASGGASTAMGSSTVSQGAFSTAMGSNTIAESHVSTAIGRYNIGGGTSNSWVDTDPLFEIGNGVSNSNRSNALTILKDGSIIQHNSDNISDESIGTSAVAFGNNTSSGGNYTLTAGTGTAAYADNAVAMGLNTTASGPNTFAVGNNSSASGDASIALGRSSLSQGDYSFSAGNQARAFGSSSISLGQENFSSGNRSVSIGYLNNSRSANSATIGVGLESNIMNQVVLGRYNEPWPTDNLSGFGVAVPILIIGNGFNVASRSNALTILGSGFTGIGVDDPQEQLHINGRLRIGTETIEDTGSNRLSFNAHLLPDVNNTMQLGSSSFRWQGLWATDGTINTSDRRDKTNIKTIDYGLNEVLKMNPVSYNWKNRKNQDTKLGLIAQDLLELVPEVVKTLDWEKDEISGVLIKKEMDRLGVYYSDLIPVLIKAIQDQQKIIETLNTKNGNQDSKLKSIEQNYQSLLSRIKHIESKSSN
jgi:hypothetical protein